MFVEECIRIRQLSIRSLFAPCSSDNGIKDMKLLEHEDQSAVSSYVFQALDSIASDTSHSLAQETCPSWVRSILVPGNLLYLFIRPVDYGSQDIGARF